MWLLVDMFLKLKSPDVTGEATDADHKGEIEVVSWSWGIQGSTDVATGQAAAKPKLTELRIVKRIDRSSPVFMQLAKNNKVTELATLTPAQGRNDPADLLQDRAEEGPRHFCESGIREQCGCDQHRDGGAGESRFRIRDGDLHPAGFHRRQGWRRCHL